VTKHIPIDNIPAWLAKCDGKYLQGCDLAVAARLESCHDTRRWLGVAVEELAINRSHG